MSRRKITTEEFIEKAKKVHGDRYDYSKVKYNGNHEKVCIICSEHGEFWQRPYEHLMGLGCNLCSKPVHDTQSFIKQSVKIHGNKYNYSNVIYKGCYEKVSIICPIHGEFIQSPTSHLKGCGCQKCKSSHLELKLRLFLENNNIEYEEQKTFEWLKLNKQQYLDFYIPKYNIAIECQGEQHFQKSGWGKGNGGEMIIKRDINKKKLCEEHGIKILYYSNLGIEYPYKVYENENELLKEIKNC